MTDKQNGANTWFEMTLDQILEMAGLAAGTGSPQMAMQLIEKVRHRLRELADNIEAKSKVEEPQEPEYTLEATIGGGWRVRCGGRHVTVWLTAKPAANIANALNSFEAMKKVCNRVVAVWDMDSLGEAATKAVRLATLYDDKGRKKDG